MTTLAVVNFTVDSILERDGWTCQACFISTPKSVRGTNAANEPHMDHIVPLSRGGDHAPSNCRCLCRKCNLDKGSLTDREWQAKKRKREKLAA
ncbi:HNH endonuclease [Rhizobium azibense]|uniref:HNH endonuclease n=1 Tax=Rhizobium azibense TaxID=1136135 RepID=UPI0014053C72